MIRAYVSDSNYGASIAVSIIRQHEDTPRRILHFETVGGGENQRLVSQWHTLEPDEATKPTLVLEHDQAIALMQALNTHYSGVDDQRMLRKDYDAERARVDKLLGVVAGVAQARSA